MLPIRNLTFPTTVSLSALLFATITVHAQSTSPQPVADDEKETVIELSPFEVRAEGDDGYKVANSLSGTRFNTKLLDLPRAVDVITSDFMRDIGATDMLEALQYTPGVVGDIAPGGDDVQGGQFSIRGFSSNTGYRDGFASSFIIDPILVERIEVIKGPSSVFSGPIEPGGTRNYITRKPPAKHSSSVNVEYGSYENLRVQLIDGGPIDQNGKLSYRIAGVSNTNKSHQDFAGRDKYVLGGTLVWKLSKDLVLQSNLQYVYNRLVPSADIPYYSQKTVSGVTTYYYEPNVPRSFNRQGPDAKSNLLQVSGATDLTYTFSPTWSFRLGLFYSYQDLERLLIGGSTRVTTNATTGIRTVARASATYEPNAVSYTISPQAYALGSFKYAGVDHKMIIGGEYSYQDQKNDVYRRTAAFPTVNIDAGTNNNFTFGNPDDRTEYTPNDLRRVLNRSSGVSITNVLKLFDSRVTFMQAARYSAIDTIRKNLMGAGTRVSTAADDLVQSYGVSGRVFPWLTAFVSYSESFLPQTVYSFAGEILEPVKGSGWDYGLKFDIIEGRLSGSIVGYDIKRENAAFADPDHPGYYLAIGEAVSQGLEVSLTARPIEAWQIVVGYSNVDAEVVKSSTALQLGRASNVPEHQFSMWNNFRFKKGLLKGFGLGAGVVSVSNRRGSVGLPDQPGLHLPAYTKIDANMSYSTRIMSKRWNFKVTVKNLTDEEYLATSGGYALPRSVTGSVGINF
ncbi:MAG: TonB-dependent receptor [Candidatus Didemnitutus sp.]|nr:TonB-dependent receptor [Candidatus Didemnitutus sp.]